MPAVLFASPPAGVIAQIITHTLILALLNEKPAGANSPAGCCDFRSGTDSHLAEPPFHRDVLAGGETNRCDALVLEPVAGHAHP